MAQVLAQQGASRVASGVGARVVDTDEGAGSGPGDTPRDIAAAGTLHAALPLIALARLAPEGVLAVGALVPLVWGRLMPGDARARGSVVLGAGALLTSSLLAFGDLVHALPAGVVVRWDSATRKVVFAGVDIGGTLYTSPPQSLADVIASVEQQMNDLLQQAAVDASGGHYTVSDVIVTDTTATLILR